MMGQIGIVTYKQYIFISRKSIKQCLKIAPRPRWRQCSADDNLLFISGLCSHQGCRLQGAFQWAGDNAVELHLQGIQYAADQETLRFSFLIERAFLIEFRVGASLSGVGVAEKIQIRHGVWNVFYGLLDCFCQSSVVSNPPRKVFCCTWKKPCCSNAPA